MKDDYFHHRDFSSRQNSMFRFSELSQNFFVSIFHGYIVKQFPYFTKTSFYMNVSETRKYDFENVLDK